MNFERARTNEQIETRISEILVCSLELFEQEGLDKLNFLEISKKTRFTRPTIYKYFKTKEEIMLSMILHYIDTLVTFIDDAFKDKEHATVDEVVEVLTQALLNVPKFIELYALLFTVIEKNVSLEALTNFKVDLLAYFDHLASCLKKVTASPSDDTMHTFLLTYLSLAVGLYPMCFLSPLQIEAITLSQTGYTTPDFETLFKKVLRVQLHTFYTTTTS